MHYPMGIGWIWKAGASEVTVKIVALLLVFDYCYLSVFWDNAIFPGFPSFFWEDPSVHLWEWMWYLFYRYFTDSYQADSDLCGDFCVAAG